MRRSLRLQILLPFMALIIAASGMVTFLSYRFTVNMTVDNQIEGNDTLMMLLNQNLDLYLTEHERLVTALAGNDQLIARVSGQFESAAGETALLAVHDAFQEALKADNQLVNVYAGTSVKEMLVEPAANLPADYDPTQREWFLKAAAEPDKAVWVEPYVDEATKSLVLTVSKAVMANGQVAGVVGADLRIDSIIHLMDGIKLGDSGYVFLMDRTHRIISHKDAEQIGSDLSGKDFISRMQAMGSSGSFHYKEDGQEKVLSYITNERTGWSINGTVSASEFESKAAAIVQPVVAGLAIVLIVAGLLSWPLIWSILRPIKRLQAAMQEFQAGKLSVRSGIKQRNEIGKLAQVFDGMVEQVAGLMEHIRQTSDKLGESAQILLVSTAENSAASSEVAVTMQEIAAGAGDQAGIAERNGEIVHMLAGHMDAVEEQTAEMNQLASRMQEVARTNTSRLEQLSQQTQRSVAATESVTEAIASLDRSSEQIEEFVGVIAGITNQTNLLALNAAIEAARAGEHGRGFGVVASEIRKLAAHSEESLSRVHELVESIRQETRQAAALTAQASAAMTEQAASVGETNEGFSTIHEAVNQHLEGIRTVVAAVKAMAEGKDAISANTAQLQAISQSTAAGTQEVSASIEEQSASTEQLNHLARQLETAAEELRQQVRRFKQEV